MPKTRSSTRRLPAPRPRTVPPVYSLRRERNTKRRGELAELVFQLIATRMGFAVSKPYGDSERYDFILDPRLNCHSEHRIKPCHCEQPMKDCMKDCRSEHRLKDCHFERRRSPAQRATVAVEEPAFTRSPLWRIQVKASTQLLNGLYRANSFRRTPRGPVPYRPCEIDFIAAYVIPEDTWYIIPVRAVRSASLLFRRKKDRHPGLYDQYKEAWHLLRPKL